MMNFKSCIEIEGIKLIGLLNGNIDICKKIIMNNEWEEYDHIILEDENILDL